MERVWDMRRLGLLGVVCGCGVLALGQVTSSGLSGRVTVEGKGVVGATVVLRDEPSGGWYGAVSNGEGWFHLQGLRAGGPYRAEISYVGYQTAVVQDVWLRLGEEYVLNVSLAESTALLEEVVVVGRGSRFTTERTGAVTHIGGGEMSLLPTISRSVSDFVRLSPYASGMSFGGRDGRSNNFTVDGARLNNNFGLSDDLPGGGNPVSLDALEEMQIAVAPYDVRQANFIGAGINAITKSGTNTFKGSAYAYLYNQDMRGNRIGAVDFGERDKEETRIYGFTLGGPIVKDKLFFFVNVESERQPGQITAWRASEDGKDNASLLISRTTEADLQEFARLLKERYGYDAGSYSDWPGGTENTKLFGRLDWHIAAHKVSLRYNRTLNVEWFPPNGNSGDTGYRLYGMDRISRYAMSFANTAYSIRNAVNAVTAEWSATLNAKMYNQALVAYTDINDTRGSNSEPFPFIDIMYGYSVSEDGVKTQTLEPYMSAGYELFAWNNGVRNRVVNVTDNYTYYVGNHKLTAGVGYEYQTASNSYMRNGRGYYRYASFEDFINEAAPEAFALCYGYNGEQNPAAEVAFGQLALYGQDEWNVGEGLKLTAGIRFDQTAFLNKLLRNNAIYALDFGGRHVDTGRWPTAAVQASPRVGFSWDAFGDGTVKVRGGSGIFTGRLPLVFFTNMPTNAGMLQNLYSIINTTYNADGSIKSRNPQLDLLAGRIITDVNEMLARLQLPTSISEEEGTVSGSATGIDPHFKMPQIWKTSLGIDYALPLPFPLTATFEGMYSKDINAVRIVNYNVKAPTADWQRFSGSDNRYIFPADAFYYDDLKSKGACVLTNTSKGWGYTANLSLTATPVKNLHLTAAYTLTESKEISGMPGSDPTSAWQNVPSVNGPNLATLQRSQFVTPHRLIASLTWRIPYNNGRIFTDIGLFYTAYSPYAYSYTYTNDINGDGIANDLIYIPNDRDDIRFVSDADADLFWAFLDNDPYLRRHKGQYAQAYAVRAPWLHRFDLKLARNYAWQIGKTLHTVQLSLDLLNLANMLNSRWGVAHNMEPANNGKILRYEGKDSDNVPSFSFFTADKVDATFARYNNYDQTWKLQVGLRYFFN